MSESGTTELTATQLKTAQLRVTLVQCDLRWEDPAANRQRLEELLEGIDHRCTDLILLPEMFATGFTMNSRDMAESMQSGASVAWLQQQAKQRDCAIIGSIAIEDQGKYYNRLLWADPVGMIYSDKRHLFRMAGEHERYDMGNARVLVNYKGFRLLLTVCYDLRFPVWLRQQPNEDAHFEYDVLLCIANWPAARRHAWRTLLQARAIENLAYVVGVNRVGEDAKGLAYAGDSIAVDFKGEPLLDRPRDEAFVETISLDRQALSDFRDKFPAWQDADRFEVFS